MSGLVALGPLAMAWLAGVDGYGDVTDAWKVPEHSTSSPMTSLPQRSTAIVPCVPPDTLSGPSAYPTPTRIRVKRG